MYVRNCEQLRCDWIFAGPMRFICLFHLLTNTHGKIHHGCVVLWSCVSRASPFFSHAMRAAVTASLSRLSRHQHQQVKALSGTFNCFNALSGFAFLPARLAARCDGAHTSSRPQCTYRHIHTFVQKSVRCARERNGCMGTICQRSLNHHQAEAAPNARLLQLSAAVASLMLPHAARH